VEFMLLNGRSGRPLYDGNCLTVIIGAPKSKPWQFMDAFKVDDYLELSLPPYQ